MRDRSSFAAIGGLLLAISLSFLLCGVAEATNYYVDKNASGANNGSSWANAWESFSAISWGSVGPGDTIYISGGSSSKTYNETLEVGASGSAGNPLTITRGTDPGHDGTVILDGQMSLSYGVRLENEDYVTIRGLDVGNYDGSGMFRIRYSTGVVVEDNDIYITGHGGVNLRGNTNAIVRNNRMTTPDYTSEQTDGIYSGLNNGNIYEHNSIVITNEETGGHNDGIQMYQDTDITIRFNFIHLDNTKTSNSQGIYCTTSDGTILAYGNVVYGPYTGNGLLTLRPFEGNAILIAYNNTLVGGFWGTIRIDNAPGSVVKNNVLMLTQAGSTMGVYGSPSSYDINYNLYWNPASSYLATQDGSGKSWSEWKALGYEANGVNANPQLRDIGQLDFRLSAGSPAIDAGVALGAPYNVDKNGISRPQGAGWDMGAYEFLNGPPINNPPSVSATATSPVVQPGPSSLDGTSSDDGLPDPPAALTFSWSKVSGPGTATFANSNAEDTTATFSAPGTYVLRLTASDSELQNSADVSVLVYPTGTVNQPPTVSATTPTPTVTEPGPATLDGTVSDDGLPNPPGTFTTAWTKTSGPGSVTFADSNAVDTTATFSAPGSYVLRLTANDSQATNFAEVGVTVIIPPPSVDIRVDAGSDDAEERPTGGGVYVTSSDLEMVDDGGNIQTVAMRFTGVNIPPGATIVEAWIQFQVDETASQATSLTIQGQDSDDPAGFTTDVGSISSRPRTSASVPWSPPAWNQIGAAGADQRTPSFPAVIQEIVDRPGWTSGNALVVIVTGSGKRVAESYEGDPGAAPLLHVGFDPGSATDWIFIDDFETGDTGDWSARFPAPPN